MVKDRGEVGLVSTSLGMAEAEGVGKGEWRLEWHWYQWCDTGKCISRGRGGEGEAVSIAWTSMGAVEAEGGRRWGGSQSIDVACAGSHGSGGSGGKGEGRSAVGG